MSEPERIVVADAAAASELATEHIAAILADAVRQRGRAAWATTGGSTPLGIYRRLIEPAIRDSVPWQHVDVWWGDDRFVPRDHPLSNVKPLDDILLDIRPAAEGAAAPGPGRVRRGVDLPIANLHPFPIAQAIAAGSGPEACAEAAEVALRAAGLSEADGWPVFDLVLLGIGGDGHLLSVFPGSTAFDARAWVLAIPAPTHIEPHVVRITLNPAVLAVARRLLVVSHGASKAGVIGDIFGPVRDVRRWPAQLTRRGNATWIVDEAAASRLER